MYIVGRETVDKCTGEGQSTDAKENNSQGELQSNTPIHVRVLFTHIYTHVKFERRHRFSDDEDSD